HLLDCARGDMENCIKEQFELFADRTSCHKWWPNQFRLLLAGLAYSLLTAVRRLGLRGTELARAQAGTIRLKLLKIGAVIWRNTRRIRFCLSSACPDKHLFMAVAQRLTAGEPPRPRGPQKQRPVPLHPPTTPHNQTPPLNTTHPHPTGLLQTSTPQPKHPP